MFTFYYTTELLIGKTKYLHRLFSEIFLPPFFSPRVTCVINCELKTKGQNMVLLSSLLPTGENRQ